MEGGGVGEFVEDLDGVEAVVFVGGAVHGFGEFMECVDVSVLEVVDYCVIIIFDGGGGVGDRGLVVS